MIDNALATKARDGDEQAFAEIFDSVYQYVYSLAIRMLYNHHDAEDAVQTAFIKVWRNLSKWQRGDFMAWFNIVVRNSLLDSYRTKKRLFDKDVYLSKTDFDDLMPSASFNQYSPLEGMIIDERMQMLEDALCRFNRPNERLAYILMRFHNYPQSEVARIMKCRVGTVKIRVYRAEQFLKSVLKEGE